MKVLNLRNTISHDQVHKRSNRNRNYIAYFGRVIHYTPQTYNKWLNVLIISTIITSAYQNIYIQTTRVKLILLDLTKRFEVY